MNKNIRSLFYTLICFILLTILVSLVLSILYFFNLFISYLSIFSKIFGYLIFVMCAFLLGKNIKEKTFFYAFGLSCIGFMISFILIEKSFISILLLSSKWILFIIVSMISRNI